MANRNQGIRPRQNWIHVSPRTVRIPILSMPFGLREARGTFQRSMDVVLLTVKWQFALDYLDNIVIFSKTTKEHIYHMREVLTLLNIAGVPLKLNNFQFFAKTFAYLGHVIGPRRLEMYPIRLAPYMDFKNRPT